MAAALPLILFVLVALLASIPAVIADRKGHSAFGFYVFGFFLFVPALIVALVISNPQGKELALEAF
jgi:hypothetical protein